MKLRTRWPLRRSLAFDGTKYLAQIENKVPGLAKALDAAHKQYVKDFWAKVPLKKAEPDNSAEVKISPADIALMRGAIAELHGEPWATALYDHLQILVEAGWAHAKELLDIKAELSDVKQSFAMEALRKRADDFAFLVNEREQDYLNQLLDTGLSEGWTPKKLADEISRAFAEGYHITDEHGQLERVVPTDTWAETVARTELSRAQIMGTVSLYEAAGVQKVMYVTTQGGNVCDICGEFDGQVYTIEEAPEIPQHPNCCCAYMAADEDVKYEEPE